MFILHSRISEFGHWMQSSAFFDMFYPFCFTMLCNILVLFAVLCSLAANAHICMWAPVQRNGYSIETPGER